MDRCRSSVFQTRSSPTVDGPEWVLIGSDRSVDGEDDGSAARRGDARLVEAPAAAAGVGESTQVWSGLSGARRDSFSGDVCVEAEEMRFRVEYFRSLLAVEDWKMV